MSTGNIYINIYANIYANIYVFRRHCGACTLAYLFCVNLFPYFIVAWQQPYVNLFKSYGTAKWEKCCKKGDVSQVMVI